jgi:hypothetical protein
MTHERLEELETLDPGDVPDDARMTIPAADLRDLVSLAVTMRKILKYLDEMGGPRRE